jgi:hypothetical protein
MERFDLDFLAVGHQRRARRADRGRSGCRGVRAPPERRAVEPYGWVINASLAASGTTDPVLRRRAALEVPLIKRVRSQLATRGWIVPWRNPAEA